MKRCSNNKPPLCQCGCRQPVIKNRAGRYNSYLLGHNNKSRDNAGKWRPGQSGNPAGCKTGSRSKISRSAEAIINGEAEVLTRKLIELGKAGNVSCLLTAIKTLVPPKRSSSLHLPDMPKVNTVADASKLTGYVLDAVASGKLSPVDGETISRSCERHLRALQVGDLESRLAELEKQLLDAGQ